MAWNTHIIDAFADTVLQLVSGPKRALLPEACVQFKEPGEVVGLSTVGGDDMDDAAAAALDAVTNVETDRSPADVAALLSTMTPNYDPGYNRSLCTNKKVHWGTAISEENQGRFGPDPKNAMVQGAVQKINKQLDQLVLDALSAASVLRGRTEADASAAAFPAGQKITIDATSDSEVFKLEHISLIKAYLEKAYQGDEFYLAIPPMLRHYLIKNSGNQITSKDFIDSPRVFEEGRLPDIYGCHVIVTPLISDPVEGASDTTIYAWAKNAVAFNTATPIQKSLAVDPAFQFALRLYLRGYFGSVRVDDKGVLQVTYDVTP